jgi:Nucleotidyl transferase
VGGKGTRLGELTRTTPKPLIEIAENKSFLDIVIEQVARQGFDDIVLLAGYLGDLVRARYDGRASGTARIRVVVETEPLGTAGALAAARDLIAPRFLMVNGDTFFDIDLRTLCASRDDLDCDAMLALHRVPDASRYGSVVLEKDRIVSFREKATLRTRVQRLFHRYRRAGNAGTGAARIDRAQPPLRDGGALDKTEPYRDRREPHQSGQAQRAEHRRRTKILDAANVIVRFARDVIGQLFDGRVQEFHSEHDEHGADHGDIPGDAWRNEKSKRQSDDQEDRFVA